VLLNEREGALMRARTRKLALTEGVTAGILFGTAAIFIRFLPGVGVFSIAFWRLIIACLMLVSLLLVLRRSFDLGSVRKNIRSLLILSFFLGLHFIFFISAVKDTTILNATVLINTTPIFSVFMSSFLSRLKPSRLAILGITISFAGLCIIAYAETLKSTAVQMGSVSPSPKGDLEAVLGALAEAFYLTYGKRLRSQMDILPTMLPMYLFAAIFVIALGVPVGGEALMLPTATATLLPLMGLGILPTAVAHTLYFSSLSDLKSFETATMALLEPVGATVLGVAVFREVPAPLFILGAFFVFVGIFFVVENRIESSEGRIVSP
jgi:drug/metabolite transporter (DMT)-like permease